jgi:predicted kinase
LILIRCHAPVEVLRARILDHARQASDPSEADLTVLEHQQKTFEPIDPAEALDVIDAETTRETIIAEIERVLSSRSVSG